MLRAVLQLLGQVPVEHVPRLERDVVDHPDTRLDVEHEVDVLAHELAIGFRHADQRGDHLGREPRREVLDVVELVVSELGVEQLGAQVADARFELRHPPRRERAGHERTELRVVGWIHEDHEPAAHRLRRHHLQHGAVRRAERRVVAVRGFDIGVPAQRVEVEALVAIQRRVVTQAPPHFVRIAVELDVERIPVEVAHRALLLRGGGDAVEDRRRTPRAG